MDQPNLIYYNLNMLCKKTSSNEPDQPAVFSENRQSVLVRDASKYNFSITRFTLESNNIPVMIPKIQTAQNDVNLCTYGMQLIYTNGASVVKSDVCYLKYVCQNKFVGNGASSPMIAQQNSPYYYILNVQEVVDMFNTASKLCMADLISKEDSVISQSPYLIYNGDTTFSLYFDKENFGTGGYLQLAVNDDLRLLFQNFSYEYVQNNNVNNYFIVHDKIMNTSVIDANTYLIEKQSYSSFHNWSPVQSIVFSSNIGTFAENVADPQILSSNSIFGLTSNRVENIITDIILPINNPMDYNSFIMYNANVYRESNLRVDEVRSIGMSIYWKDKLGLQYPVMLSDGNNVTVKIKFEKI